MKRSLLLIASLVVTVPAFADVQTLGGGPNSTKLRLRVGTNASSGIDKVIFDVPGLQLGDGTQVISTNAIAGASGVYTVRFVLDNRRLPAGTARLNADSSSPLACITATSCGTTTIQFNKISWQLRDGDNMDLASAFNDSSNQLE